MSDTKAIEFLGLVLHSKREDAEWLITYYPNERGDNVADFHTLMENIQQSIVGTDSISRLNSLYKLKIYTMS